MGQLVIRSSQLEDRTITLSGNFGQVGAGYTSNSDLPTWQTPNGWCGGKVDIVIPPFPTGTIRSCQYVISGSLAVTYSAQQVANPPNDGVAFWEGVDSSSVVVFYGDGAGIQFFPDDGLNSPDNIGGGHGKSPWWTNEAYQYYDCPCSGGLVGGMENFVQRGVAVCSGNYYQGARGRSTSFYGNTTVNYTYLDETQAGLANGDLSRDLADFVNCLSWLGARTNTTQSLCCRWGLRGLATGWPYGPNPATSGFSITNLLTNCRLVILINYDDVTPPSWVGPHVLMDTFNNVVGGVWVGAAVSGSKPLYVGVHRGIQKAIGTGSGSSQGWEVYKLMDIPSGSDWGMVILPSGRMVVMYDTIGSNGAATAQYRASDNWAQGAGATWSAAAALTPNRSQAVSIGRAQKQGWRFTVTG